MTVDPLSAGIVGIALLIGCGTVAVSVTRARQGLDARLNHIAEHITPASAPPTDLLERLESVERRLEVVHGECLNYLRRGESSLSRARKLRAVADDDDDEGVDPEVQDQLRMALAAQAQDAPGRANGQAPDAGHGPAPRGGTPRLRVRR